MNLETLIEKSRHLSNQIAICVANDQDSPAIRELDQKLTEVLEKIRTYSPRNLLELKNKLTFFVNEAELANPFETQSFAMQAISELLKNDFSIPFQSELSHSNYLIEDPYKSINAFDFVTHSQDRVSIIDMDYRYVTTSGGNNEFYKTKSNNIIGQHVGEVIGERRFEDRAQDFLDRCFSGKKQQYFHTLETDAGSRIMNCQMVPLLDAEETLLGGVVTMNDVTSQITNTDSVVLQGL